MRCTSQVRPIYPLFKGILDPNLSPDFVHQFHIGEGLSLCHPRTFEQAIPDAVHSLLSFIFETGGPERFTDGEFLIIGNQGGFLACPIHGMNADMTFGTVDSEFIAVIADEITAELRDRPILEF
jgi:hypothetical protein